MPLVPGAWQFQVTPAEKGTRVDVRAERHPTGDKSKTMSSALPFAGPVPRKSFKAPLHTT